MNLQTCSDSELRQLVRVSEVFCDRAQAELDRRAARGVSLDFAGRMTAGRETVGRWDVARPGISGRPAVASRLPSRTSLPASICAGGAKEVSPLLVP